jgi:cytochrome P450
MLARKELAIALPRLLSRLRNIRIIGDSDTRYWPGLLHRGIGSLHIAFDREEEIA